MPNTLKVIFAGTPEFAATHLSALIKSNQEIVGVYTQPDRPKGRGKQLQASAVKAVALDADLPVFQPASLKGEAAQEELKSLGADIMIVVAYGLLLPQTVLDIPRLGCINVHGSILPRWRGAAPIQRAIEAGDTQSGVTIMQMEAGLDTGPMLFKSYCDITNGDTAATLHDKLAALGPPALLETIDKLNKQEIEPEAQDDELANYAHKLSKEEGLIDWSQAADVLDRKIRAFNPFPMTYTLLDGERIRIIEAKKSSEQTGKAPGTIMSTSKDGIAVSVGKGLLTLTHIQLPGKKTMNVADVLNGFAEKFKAGTVFG